MRTQYRIMVDASAFLQDLRLYARRLAEDIVDGGVFASDREIWVCAQLQTLVQEIEDGYATLFATGRLPSAPPEAGVGEAELQPDAGRASVER